MQMVNKKITRNVASLLSLLLLTGTLGACNAQDGAAASEGTTTEITIEATSASSEETESSRVTETTETESDYYFDVTQDPYFVSSNGELEGQDEYMVLCTPENCTMPSMIDINEIEEDDLRALAQSYADEGYYILDRLSPQNYGDYEYTFCRGFSGQCIVDGVMKEISVWKMNETLFNYFVLGHGVWWNDGEGSYSDDGTCITRSIENNYQGNHFYACFEFNRDTGIMTFYAEDTNPDNWSMLYVGPTLHGDEDINEWLASCNELGYQTYAGDIGDNEWIDYEWEGEEYQIMVGFESLYVDDDIMITIRVLKMDEDCFDNAVVERLSNDPADLEVTDDGNTVRYLEMSYGGGTVYEYNRDTGVAVIYECWFFTVDAADVTSDMVVEGLDELHGC